MNTWLKLKTKPFFDFEDAEKFVRHFKSINPKRKYKAGFADGDVVVFVTSKDSMIEVHTQ
jgi:hypothetical protein